MPKPKLILYGNGHIAKMMYQFSKRHYDLAAFTVDEQCIDEATLFDIPVLPFADIEKKHSPQQHRMLTAVGFLEMNTLRDQKYQEGKLKGYSFINYIHPSVDWHDTITIGENNIILDHVALHPFVQLGNSNFISSNSNVGHGCQIGSNCWINGGVAIGGESRIEDYAFIGINASIGHGITVAQKTFVGANTQIVRNTDQNAVYLSPPGEKFRLTSTQFLRFSNAI